MTPAAPRTQTPSRAEEDTHVATPNGNTSCNEEAGQNPLDMLIPDPSDMTPLCDEPQFAEMLENMVADAAPCLFAVVQEYGNRVDGRIAAWGMAFGDHAEVVSVEGGMRRILQAPENALRVYAWGSHIHSRLVWLNPDAVTHAKNDEVA